MAWSFKEICRYTASAFVSGHSYIESTTVISNNRSRLKIRMEISRGHICFFEGGGIIQRIQRETVIAMDDFWKNSQERISNLKDCMYFL